MKNLAGLATFGTIVAAVLLNPLIGLTQDVDPREFVAQTEQAREQVIRNNLTLTPEEAEAFWPLYKSFRAQIGPHREELVNLVLEYAEAYPDLSDAQAVSLFDRLIKAREKEAKLKTKYLKKFRKALSPKHAIRYAQLERKMDAAIDFEAAVGIPLVE